MAFPPFTRMISLANATALADGCCACTGDSAARTRARSPAHADRPTTLATMATPLLDPLMNSVLARRFLARRYIAFRYLAVRYLAVTGARSHERLPGPRSPRSV